MMASPKTHRLNRPKVLVLAVLVFFNLFLSPRSVDGVSLFPIHSGNFHKRRLVLGSRPPGCTNKCFSCSPCVATLVVPSQPRSGINAFTRKTSSHEDDDIYYLLSWKCRCGDKIFQP